MKAIKHLLGILFLSIILVNCSKKDSGINEPATAPTVTTGDAENIVGTSVTLNCIVNSAGSSALVRYGVCASQDHNPTVANSVGETSGGDVGSHSFNVQVAEANKTYYVRAYAENSVGISYGSEISFVSLVGITTQAATAIVPTAALLRANTTSTTTYSISSRGFVYSTSPNPSLQSSSYVFASGGFGDYSSPIASLTPNTTYYVKPFFSKDGSSNVIYGDETNFKTTGYFGPGACYVVYDKGETTDGWRYMEVSPVGIDYDITWTNGAKWGCVGSFLSLTYPEIGTGVANTQRIISMCSSANCAARLCDNWVHNGQSDWFLMSKDEMLMAAKALQSLGVHTEYSYTSTENNTDYAYVIDWQSSAYVITTGYKDAERYVYPARRY